MNGVDNNMDETNKKAKTLLDPQRYWRVLWIQLCRFVDPSTLPSVLHFLKITYLSFFVLDEVSVQQTQGWSSFFQKNSYYAKIGVNRLILGSKSTFLQICLLDFSEMAPDYKL